MNEFLICFACGHAWLTYSWGRSDHCLECGYSLEHATLVRKVEGEPRDTPEREHERAR